LYDHDTDSEWITSEGQGKNAWVDIQLQSSISIKKIEVLQPASLDGLFKQISISFSNGESRKMHLESEPLKWYAVEIQPPIKTTSLKMVAQEHHTPENLAKGFYRIREVSINGDRGN
jgi:hypothetical protein